MKTLPKNKIGFNGSCLMGQGLRGWSRYTTCLLEALTQEFGTTHEFLVLKNEKSRQHTLWEQLHVPMQIAREKIQIFHGPANGGLPLLATCPTVLTLHDLFSEEAGQLLSIWQQLGDLKSLLRYKLDWYISLYRADRIITISDYCKDELIAHGLPAEKIRVIYEGAAAGFAPRPVRQPRFRDEKYFIYVGGFEERKNIGELLDVFSKSQLAAKLYLVGKADSWGQAYQAQFAGDPRICFLGYLSDEDLAEAYSGAMSFVTFSLKEGFGLPLVEAMACGCPVLTTVGGALKEIAGRGGQVITRDSFVAAAEALLSSNERLQQAKALAFERGKFFSWNKTARETLAVYNELCTFL